jgi:hypothetical protein
VTVTTPGGTTATREADRFTYVPAPTVTAIKPQEGPSKGGTSVTIAGTNLGKASAVKFGSSPAAAASCNATECVATSPTGTGTVDVTVTTPGGTGTATTADRFTYVPVPAVTAIKPAEGPVTGGTVVTITGTNLGKAVAVKFGSIAATTASCNATECSATSPAGTGTVNVTVTTLGGTSAATTPGRFSYVAAPTVAGIKPKEGPVTGGTLVTVTGTNFGKTPVVKFGSNAAISIIVKSATSLTAISPPGSGTVDVSVLTAGGASATSSADQFIY